MTSRPSPPWRVGLHQLESASAALQQYGFVHIPQALSADDLATIRLAISEILASDVLGQLTRPDDLLRDAQRVPRKICYPLAKSRRLLPMLALPNLGRVIEAISGEEAEHVLTWEDILLKPAHVGAEVVVHQDLALQKGAGRVFSLGLHLHDATDNPVYFLPGSHNSGALTRRQVRTLRQEHEFTPAAPLAGDIVVHSPYCVHYSDRNLANTPRHVWYLEFRELKSNVRSGPWSPDWFLQRRAVLFHAAAAREASGLSTWWPHAPEPQGRNHWLSLPLALRTCHVGNGVEYDVSSPYYHFES